MVAHTPCRYANDVPQNGGGSKSCSQVIHKPRTLKSFGWIRCLDARRVRWSARLRPGLQLGMRTSPQQDEMAQERLANVSFRRNIKCLSSGWKREEWHSRCCLILINGKPFTIARVCLPASAAHNRRGNRRDVKLSNRPRFRRRNPRMPALKNSTDAGYQPRSSHWHRTKPGLGANPGR